MGFFALRDRATYNLRVLRRASAVAVVLAALIGAGGCAGPASGLRRDRAALDEDVASLRAELRRDKRKIRDLETENLVLRDKIDTAEVSAGRVGGVPRLPVEVLGPDEEDGGAAPAIDDEYGDDARVVATTDDGTEIVYIGDAATGKSVEAPDDLELSGDDDGGDLRYAPDDDEQVVDDDPPPAPRAKPRKKPAKKPAKKGAPSPGPDDDGGGRGDSAAAAYEAAVAKVRARQHDGALAALRTFLEDYPRHDLADNAQYWLGEVYYDGKDWARALVEFRATVEKYPRGNKVPDAMLKMGYCFASLGQTTKARAALEQVVQVYPKTQPAILAAKKLEQL